MKTMAALQALFACIALTACQTMVAQTGSPPPPTKSCKDADPECNIVVSVGDAGSGCRISVDHLTVQIDRERRGKPILWSLDVNGQRDYEFDGGAITFPTAPAGQFVGGTPMGPGKSRYHVIARNDPAPDPFKYVIKVSKKGGSSACQPGPLDPWIKNG